MLALTNHFYKVQRKMSDLQANIIIGPVLFSPAKIVLSLIQIVNGLGLLIFSKISRNIFSLNFSAKLYDEAYGLIGFGIFSTVYAVSNLISLGIIGYLAERPHNFFNQTI